MYICVLFLLNIIIQSSIGVCNSLPGNVLYATGIKHMNNINILGYGVLAQCAEHIYMSGNALHANRNIGMLIKQPLLVTIVNNSITGNEGAGLQIAADGKVSHISMDNIPRIPGNTVFILHTGGLYCKQSCSFYRLSWKGMVFMTIKDMVFTFRERRCFNTMTSSVINSVLSSWMPAMTLK